MSTVAISVELDINITNSTATARVRKVSDSVGADRTAEFVGYCRANSLPITSQSEIEHAIVEYVKAHQSSLP